MQSVLKYPGSKGRVANWIVGHIPPHDFYVEPFFGSGAVLFAKPRSKAEVVNDLDGNVVNFFRVCRDAPEELARALYLTPCSRSEYEEIQEIHAGQPMNMTGQPLEDARRFAIRCIQGAGTRIGQRTGWKKETNSIVSNTARSWSYLPDKIAPVAERLRGVAIENMDALELIQKHNTSNTLLYCDPPYLGSTRGGSIYRFEMRGEELHRKLLQVLMEHKGPVILSGYENDLYNKILLAAGWNKDSKEAYVQGGGHRTETIWFNFEYEPEKTMFEMG